MAYEVVRACALAILLPAQSSRSMASAQGAGSWSTGARPRAAKRSPKTLMFDAAQLFVALIGAGVRCRSLVMMLPRPVRSWPRAAR